MPQLHRFLPRLPIFKSLSVKTNDKGLNTFGLTHMFSSCSTQAHFESSPVKVTFCSHSKSRCTRLPDKNILGEFMESQPSRVSPAGRLLHAPLIFTWKLTSFWILFMFSDKYCKFTLSFRIAIMLYYVVALHVLSCHVVQDGNGDIADDMALLTQSSCINLPSHRPTWGQANRPCGFSQTSTWDLIISKTFCTLKQKVAVKLSNFIEICHAKCKMQKAKRLVQYTLSWCIIVQLTCLVWARFFSPLFFLISFTIAAATLRISLLLGTCRT